MFMFFFFKQKTAYEVRISDWSSDVCSSDLFSLRLASLGDQRDRFVPIMEEALSVIEEHAAGVGEAADAGGALEQLRLKQLLQQHDRAADMRRRPLERCCTSCEVAGGCNRHKLVNHIPTRHDIIPKTGS